MKTFKGDLIIKKGDNTDYSHLTTVTGHIYIYEGGSLDAPNLKESGYIDIYEGGSYSAAKRHDLLMGIDRDKSGKISVKLKFDHTDNLRWKKTKKETILETIIPKAN